MTFAYTELLRNDRLQKIIDAIDSGVGVGRFIIYNGNRPLTGGLPTTKLAELFFSKPSFFSPSGGSAIADVIEPESSAKFSGTPTWFRLETSSGTFVADGDVGIVGSGAELEMQIPFITENYEVHVNSFVLTEGNP